MVVSEKLPPALPFYATYWERSADPFHPYEFEGTGVKIDWSGESKSGPPRNGWMAIDWCGNSVGWVPDGAPYMVSPVDFEFRTGPYGRLCAYPKSSS